jgi:hypothetical protein
MGALYDGCSSVTFDGEAEATAMLYIRVFEFVD